MKIAPVLAARKEKAKEQANRTISSLLPHTVRHRSQTSVERCMFRVKRELRDATNDMLKVSEYSRQRPTRSKGGVSRLLSSKIQSRTKRNPSKMGDEAISACLRNKTLLLWRAKNKNERKSSGERARGFCLLVQHVAPCGHRTDTWLHLGMLVEKENVLKH